MDRCKPTYYLQRMVTGIGSAGTSVPLVEAVLLLVRHRSMEVSATHRKCQRELSEPHVHALRQAARRLAAPLEICQAWLPGAKRIGRARRKVARILRWTSTLRDLHVRIQALEEVKDDALRGTLLQHTEQELRKRERKVGRQLARLDLGSLMRLDPGSWPPLTAEEAQRGFQQVLDHRRGRLQHRIERLRITRPATLHRARVALKRYRYLLNDLGTQLPGQSRPGQPLLVRYQPRLGAWHDAHLLTEWLWETSNELAPGLRRACRTLAREGHRQCAKEARALVAQLRLKRL